MLSFALLCVFFRDHFRHGLKDLCTLGSTTCILDLECVLYHTTFAGPLMWLSAIHDFLFYCSISRSRMDAPIFRRYCMLSLEPSRNHLTDIST